MDNEKWLPYEEYVFQQKYFAARERELIETAGMGYEKTSIVNENSEWLKQLKNETVSTRSQTRNS